MEHEMLTGEGRGIGVELAELLEGTCMSLGEACTALNIDPDTLTNADHEQLDAEVFECALCGWWCPDGEQAPDCDSTEPICEECYND